MAKPKEFWETHTEIKCECGNVRVIRNQDIHQVTKCKSCQYDFRLKRRKELREQKIKGDLTNE